IRAGTQPFLRRSRLRTRLISLCLLFFSMEAADKDDGALESRLIEILFGEVEPGDPLSPPIVLSTNFKHGGVGESWEYSYTRTGNPSGARVDHAPDFRDAGVSGS